VSRYLENLTCEVQRMVDILDGVYPTDSPEGRLVAAVEQALADWAETEPARRRARTPVVAQLDSGRRGA
jgi:hypothetical protein